MPWLKVDEHMPNHPKFIDAGGRLDRDDPQSTGATGLGRVIAVWNTGMCHCNASLTDGFISDAFVTNNLSRIDGAPVAVLSAMQHRTRGLVRRVRGGWAFVNYHEYQPAKADVEKQREKDRNRMRRSRGVRANNVGTVREKFGRSSGNVQTSVPSRPVPKDQDQDPRAAAFVGVSEIRKQLRAALHAHLDDHPADATNDGELTEVAKQYAARTFGAVWAHADEIARVVDSVVGERARRVG